MTAQIQAAAFIQEQCLYKTVVVLDPVAIIQEQLLRIKTTATNRLITVCMYSH